MSENMLDSRHFGGAIADMRAHFRQTGFASVAAQMIEMQASLDALTVEHMSPQKFAEAIIRIEKAFDAFCVFWNDRMGRADVSEKARKMVYQVKAIESNVQYFIAREQQAIARAEEERLAASRAKVEAEQEAIRAVERAEREAEAQKQRDQEEAARIRRLLDLPPAPAGGSA